MPQCGRHCRRQTVCSGRQVILDNMALPRCAECGEELQLDDLACPQCGSGDRLVYDADQAAGIESSWGIKGRHGTPGQVKPYLRTTMKREWSPSRNAWEEVTRVFDSDARIYRETYRSLETGEVTFHKEGAIEDQGLHGPGGSSRPRPPST
jgi:hypothetical protein